MLTRCTMYGEAQGSGIAMGGPISRGEAFPTAPVQPEPYQPGGNLQTTSVEITPAHYFYHAVQMADFTRKSAQQDVWTEDKYVDAAVLYYTRIREITEALNTAIDADPQWARHELNQQLVSDLVIIDRIATAYYQGMTEVNRRKVQQAREAIKTLDDYMRHVQQFVVQAGQWVKERAKDVAEAAGPAGVGVGLALGGLALLLLAFKR